MHEFNRNTMPIDRFYKYCDRLKRLELRLHLLRQVIEAHNGKIWAKKVLSQGAKFCFNLLGKN